MIHNKKFDFRVYVLVTQVTPEIQIFLYKDGLARFATEDYDPKGVLKAGKPPSPRKHGEQQPVDPILFMHLTNYAINKESENFAGNEADYKKTL